jgi:type IV pilus assembly protein PilB
MKITPKKLKQTLVDFGFITEADFKSAQKEAKEKNISIEQVLIEKELITDEHLGKLISEELGYKFVDLRKERIPGEIINIIPELVAKMQQVIVFDKTKAGLKVAMADPGNFEMIDWLEKKTGEKIIPYYATPRDIRGALKYYRKELEKTFDEIISAEVKIVKKKKVKAEDIPIIKIVDTLIEYAYINGASDIHIEPLEEETQVRFRIDGVLHNVLTLPKNIHNLIVTRIKVLSKLRTDEHFAAQDGKFVVKFEKERFDIRVSIIPVTEGENTVMRLLSERARRFVLDGLGLSDKDLKKIKNAVKKPYGMMLATGPTGCGKTTTLYTILKILNNPGVNVCTIEDPVEYDMEGVSQIQVNPKTNLTFVQGLRSIVRQDPDIIMVGEIRDNETADIAINSAMTGHLVLSTMHANTAATNLPRLIEIIIQPFWSLPQLM